MVDLGSPEKTRSYTGERREILARVARDRASVLDLGCATGALGAAIKARQDAVVCGVEYEPQMAAVARKRLDHVVEGDLNQWDAIAAALDGRTFDCIVCADVLEHVVDPWTLGRELVSLLRPGGHLVISIPNVGHLDTLWNVFVRHTWPHRERGIHDRTHLRWFASRDVRRLVADLGLHIRSFDRMYRLVEHPAKINRRARYVALIPGLRDLLTFHFVVVAASPGSPGAGA